MESSMQEQVRSFFNRIAGDYAGRYSDQQPFLQYLHRERMEKACTGLPIREAQVLDVGAGTGQLYHWLQERVDTNFQYLACDIAEEMRAASSIPPELYLIGTPSQLDLPKQAFDFIFLLGVTSYLSPAEWEKEWQCLHQLLRPNGYLMVSFTHAASWDYQIRQLAQQLLPRRLFKDRLLSQGFRTVAYSPPQVVRPLASFFEITRFFWLNQGITPLNRIFPKWSIRQARRWAARPDSSKVKQRLSGDFLIQFRKKSDNPQRSAR